MNRREKLFKAAEDAISRVQADTAVTAASNWTEPSLRLNLSGGYGVEKIFKEDQELLPCPWCGDTYFSIDEFGVQCDCIYCGAKGPIAQSNRPPVAAWNSVAGLRASMLGAKNEITLLRAEVARLEKRVGLVEFERRSANYDKIDAEQRAEAAEAEREELIAQNERMHEAHHQLGKKHNLLLEERDAAYQDSHDMRDRCQVAEARLGRARRILANQSEGYAATPNHRKLADIKRVLGEKC